MCIRWYGRGTNQHVIWEGCTQETGSVKGSHSTIYFFITLGAAGTSQAGVGQMKLDIPVRCKKCGGKMYCVSYDVIFKILKNRSWHVCKNCSWSQSVDDFKKEMLTIWTAANTAVMWYHPEDWIWSYMKTSAYQTRESVCHEFRVLFGFTNYD